MSVFSPSPPTLSTKDFTLFYSPFCRKIEQLLPVSGTVFFWGQEGQWLTKKQEKELLGLGIKKIPALCESLEPAVINSVLVLPVAVVDGRQNFAVIIADMDAGVLSKMAPEWLHELRDNLQHVLIQLKQEYIYPETGLYSSRLLNLLWSEYGKSDGAFFLIGAKGRTRCSTNGLINVMMTAHQLEASTGGPVIYFGGNVFGLCQTNISRDSALHFARRLLERLKREGANTLHIGIALIRKHEEKTPDQLLDESWQALEIAEHRGPFSLCEASFFLNQEKYPLAKPSQSILRQLQNKWRGLEQFCLLLVRLEKVGEKEDCEDVSLEHVTSDAGLNSSMCVAVKTSECYVLLPDTSPKKGEQIARELKKVIEDKLKPRRVAIGVSFWPCMDYRRTSTVQNCRKALMHGDFFGPGSVTLFDHISLNVSGDHFFDEGDYRQAVREYRAGLKMNPQEVNLLNSLGVALTELNRLSEALKFFNQVLEKDPSNFMALVNKGFALRMLKKDGEALSSLAEAVKCREYSDSPVSIDISLQLGRLYFANGQYRKAINALEKANVRNSEKNGYLVYNLLGAAYAEVGKKKKAITMLQKAIRYNPHDARSLSILGELYSAQGEGNDIAVSLCTQAITLDEQSWENWYRLAKVLFTMQEYEKAQQALKESLHRSRNAIEAIFLAGKIYKEQGNIKQAKKMFQRVLRIAPDYLGVPNAIQELT